MTRHPHHDAGVTRLAGTLLRPTPDGGVSLARGALTIEHGVITDIDAPPTPDTGDTDPHASPDTSTLNPRDPIIAPGFIDAHVHPPQLRAVGAHGLELLDWLDRVVFPAEAAWAAAHTAANRMREFLDRALAAGTTGFAAYLTSHEAGAHAARAQTQAAGVRALLGPSLMDRNAPGPVIGDAGQQLQTLDALLEAPAPGRVGIAVTPRFAPACTDGLLTAAGRRAADQRHAGAPVQTHLAETRAELELVARLYDSEPYTRVYDRFGLLGPRTLLGHCIYLEDDELALIKVRGAAVVHCPTANRFLDAGRLDLNRVIAAGIPVALGSDVGAGHTLSMPRVAQAMLQTAVDLGNRPPTAAYAWWLITRGNAHTLGWNDTGRIEHHAEADLLEITPPAGWLEHPDPLSRLLWGWDDRWITRTLVAGKPVFTASA